MIDAGEADLGQLEVLAGERKKVLFFHQQQRTNALTASRQNAALITTAVSQQLRVQLGKIECCWNRHPVIASKVTGLAFDAALYCQCERKAMKRAVSSRS